MKALLPKAVATALGLVLCAASPSLAQTATPTTAADEASVDDVVVVARRSGAPTWEVTRGSGSVLLVGGILGVPKATPWRPDRLEAATLRADRVISGMSVQASMSDLFRLIWRSRTLTRLPQDKTSADYLTPEWQARLSAIETRYKQDYSRQSFLIASSDMLNDRLRFNRDTTDDASDIVKRAARKAKIPTRTVNAARGDELVENLLTADPVTMAPCMQAAIVAVEAGPQSLIERGEAWTRFNVPAVLASPLQQALNVCWPWGDPSLGTQLRAEWVNAINDSLDQTGVTMAVVTLSVLAEPGGVLDQLEAQSAEIEGPPWKASQTTPVSASPPA